MWTNIKWNQYKGILAQASIVVDERDIELFIPKN